MGHSPCPNRHTRESFRLFSMPARGRQINRTAHEASIRYQKSHVGNLNYGPCVLPESAQTRELLDASGESKRLFSSLTNWPAYGRTNFMGPHAMQNRSEKSTRPAVLEAPYRAPVHLRHLPAHEGRTLCLADCQRAGDGRDCAFRAWIEA